MVKVIILVGPIRDIKKFWEAKTSKWERVFLGKETKGRVNGISFGVQPAKIIERKSRKTIPLKILSVASIKDFSRDIPKLSEKFGVSSEETMIIISRQKTKLESIVSGRYHLTGFGWVVALKRFGKPSEMNEIVAVFFNNENQTLLHALENYRKKKLRSQMESFFK